MNRHSWRIELSRELKCPRINWALIMNALVLSLSKVLLCRVVIRVDYWSSWLLIQDHTAYIINGSWRVVIWIWHSLPETQSSKVIQTHAYASYACPTESLLRGDWQLLLSTSWIFFDDLHQLNVKNAIFIFAYFISGITWNKYLSPLYLLIELSKPPIIFD